MYENVLVNNVESLIYEGQRSLLDFLEEKGINVRYSCRLGFCGLCRVKLLKGNLVYFQTPLIQEKKDYFFSCSCTPESNIEIEI